MNLKIFPLGMHYDFWLWKTKSLISFSLLPLLYTDSLPYYNFIYINILYSWIHSRAI